MKRTIRTTQHATRTTHHATRNTQHTAQSVYPSPLNLRLVAPTHCRSSLSPKSRRQQWRDALHNDNDNDNDDNNDDTGGHHQNNAGEGRASEGAQRLHTSGADGGEGDGDGDGDVDAIENTKGKEEQRPVAVTPAAPTHQHQHQHQHEVAVRAVMDGRAFAHDHSPTADSGDVDSLNASFNSSTASFRGIRNLCSPGTSPSPNPLKSADRGRSRRIKPSLHAIALSDDDLLDDDDDHDHDGDSTDDDGDGGGGGDEEFDEDDENDREALERWRRGSDGRHEATAAALAQEESDLDMQRNKLEPASLSSSDADDESSEAGGRGSSLHYLACILSPVCMGIFFCVCYSLSLSLSLCLCAKPHQRATCPCAAVVLPSWSAHGPHQTAHQQ